MSTIYMSQLSTLPLMEGDQDQGYFPAFHLAKDPPILFPFMIDNPVEHPGQIHGDQHLRQQNLGESNQQFNDHMMMAGGSDVFARPSPFEPTIQSIGSDMIQRSLYDQYDTERKYTVGSISKQWVATMPPAKMRIMRKAATNDPAAGAARKPRRRAQAYQGDEGQQQHHVMGVIRACSDCNTTKTPLWRSGPSGPKSLCNACGIRQRKARRAMAVAAAAAANGGTAAGMPVIGPSQANPAKKEKRAAEVDRSLPFKKRCKMVDHAAAAAAITASKATDAVAAPKKDHDHLVEDVVAESMSKASPPSMFSHVCPRDEITDAAMLLMTLSCGLVRG